MLTQEQEAKLLFYLEEALTFHKPFRDTELATEARQLLKEVEAGGEEAGTVVLTLEEFGKHLKAETEILDALVKTMLILRANKLDRLPAYRDGEKVLEQHRSFQEWRLKWLIGQIATDETGGIDTTGHS